MNWICRGAIKTQEFGGMYCAIVTLKWGSFLTVFIATLCTDKVTCFDMYYLICSESVVSAAMFRIYGAEVAELPLVATRADCQGQVSLVLLSTRCLDVWMCGMSDCDLFFFWLLQGYFQTLFSCIERFLAFLNVKILLLPAADEAASIWKNKFGFQNLNQSEVCKHLNQIWFSNISDHIFIGMISFYSHLHLAHLQIFEYRKRFPILIFHGTSVLQKSVPKCRIIGSQESKLKVESS